MNRRESFFSAAAIAATALGLDMASGRAMAAFYAQTAKASWLGIGFSGLLFGLAAGCICALSRRCGAGSAGMLLRRLGCGRIAGGLYGVILLAACGMLLGEAAHIGRLVLPVHNAGLYAGLIAAALSAASVLSGRRTVQMLDLVYLACLAVYLCALLFFAEMPQTGLQYGIELKLENSYPAALLLALVHAAAAVCISAGVTVRLGGAGMRPLRLGIWSGALYAAVLMLGNAVLQAQEPILLRLKMPYIALSCAWGSTGFSIAAAMVYMGCIAGLSSILYGSIPKQKSRILIEK